MTGDRLKELEDWCNRQFEMELSSRQITQFQKYLVLLQEWNKKINLTTITDEKGIIEKHFMDSLTCLLIPVFRLNSWVMDIGSGAGFPGIPLKIVRPDLDMTLVETTGKKVQFLKKVIQEFELDGTHILKERAEILAHHHEYREKFDIVISRALAPLPVACEFCLPFVKINRVYLAMLGGDAKSQSKSAEYAIKELGGKVCLLKDNLSLPESKSHSIAVIEKITQTPSKYPRKPGIPEKRPLIIKP